MNKKEKKIMLVVSIIMFIAVVFIFTITLMHYWHYLFGLEKWEVYARVNITSNVSSFDTNGTALTFAKIKLGGSAKRYITLYNSHNFPIKVKITSEGTISPMLVYQNNVVVEKGESKNISFSAVSTRDMPLGVYEGFVHFKTFPAV